MGAKGLLSGGKGALKWEQTYLVTHCQQFMDSPKQGLVMQSRTQARQVTHDCVLHMRLYEEGVR